MPKRNRVTPYGDIVAIDLRGAWLGNRGILHEGDGDRRASTGTGLWITCALRHRDWRLPQWQPHHFTVLFFHDEAVSLAAGHRPWRSAGAPTTTPTGAPGPRRRGRTRRWRRRWTGCSTGSPCTPAPTGAGCTTSRGRACRRCVRGGRRPAGAGARRGGGAVDPRGLRRARRPGTTGFRMVLTPPSTVAALREGYRPDVDARAG